MSNNQRTLQKMKKITLTLKSIYKLIYISKVLITRPRRKNVENKKKYWISKLAMMLRKRIWRQFKRIKKWIR